MKRLFELFIKNVLTQLFTYGFIMGIMGLLSNWFDWAYPIMVVMAIIITFYVVVFIIAGIINVIKHILK